MAVPVVRRDHPDMASMHPPPASPPDPVAEVVRLWVDLYEAAEAGDVQAAVFLKTFEPWARQQLRQELAITRPATSGN